MENTVSKKRKGVVKEFRTSLYYGVRRQENPNGAVYYRTAISVENKKYYLGCFKSEQQAAYAFNVGFDSMSNTKYTIKNQVNLTDDEKLFVLARVGATLAKKGFISHKYLP